MKIPGCARRFGNGMVTGVGARIARCASRLPLGASGMSRPGRGVVLVAVTLAGAAAGEAPRPLRRAVSANGRFELRLKRTTGRFGGRAGLGGRARGRCRVVLYERGRSGRRRVWATRFVNERAPERVVIRDDGRFVATLNEYARGGAAHALVFYGEGGRLLREFSLPELLSGDDWRHVRPVKRAVRWLDGAETGFEMNPPRFVLRLAWGRRIVVDLDHLGRTGVASRPAGSQPNIPPEILALLDPPGATGGAASTVPLDAVDEALRNLRHLAALAQGTAVGGSPPAKRAAGLAAVPQPDPRNPVDYVAWFMQQCETDEPGAVPYYQAAFDAMVPWEGDVGIYNSALNGDPEALARPELQAWIEANRDALRAYFAAVELDYRGMPQPGEDGTMVGVRLPNLGNVRELARITSADALLREQRGDLEGALEGHMQNIKAGAQVSRGPTMIDNLTGVAVQACGATALLDFAARHDDDLDYATLAERLETQTCAAAPIGRTLVFEKAADSDMCQRMFAWDEQEGRYRVADGAPEALVELLGTTGDRGPAKLKKLFALGYNGFEQTRRNITQYYDLLGQHIDEPYPIARETLANIERRFDDPAAPIRYPLLSSMAPPSMSRLAYVKARGESLRRAAIVVMKLKAYRQKYGEYPAALDGLGHDEVLIDPITEDYFVYRPTEEGFMLYSVGENGIDDGGRGDPRHYSTEDIVYWPRPRR